MKPAPYYCKALFIGGMLFCLGGFAVVAHSGWPLVVAGFWLFVVSYTSWKDSQP